MISGWPFIREFEHGATIYVASPPLRVYSEPDVICRCLAIKTSRTVCEVYYHYAIMLM